MNNDAKYVLHQAPHNQSFYHCHHHLLDDLYNILQNIKVRVNFETKHQNFVRNGFSTKNSYLGVKVIDFFHLQGFTNKKGKQNKLKNLIMRAFSYM